MRKREPAENECFETFYDMLSHMERFYGDDDDAPAADARVIASALLAIAFELNHIHRALTEGKVP